MRKALKFAKFEDMDLPKLYAANVPPNCAAEDLRDSIIQTLQEKSLLPENEKSPKLDWNLQNLTLTGQQAALFRLTVRGLLSDDSFDGIDPDRIRQLCHQNKPDVIRFSCIVKVLLTADGDDSFFTAEKDALAHLDAQKPDLSLKKAHTPALFGDGAWGKCNHFLIQQDLGPRTLDESWDNIFWRDRKPKNIRRAITRFRRVLRPVEWIHEKGIVHLDIARRNIIEGIKGRSLRICDFGSSAHSNIHTPRKLLEGRGGYYGKDINYDEEGHTPTPQHDMTCLGLLLYDLLAKDGTKGIDIRGEHLQGIRSSESHETWTAQSPSDFFREDLPQGEALKSLILDLMQYDPQDRPETIGAVRERLDEIAGKL